MTTQDVINLLNEESIKKIEREAWPYGEGLLIDYLKVMDLNGKKITTVYLQVKGYINSRFPEGFKNIIEKRSAIEDYLDSEDFENYIKYGYTNKVYFYKGMLLKDFLKLNYNEILERNLKTPENLYDKIIRVIKANKNIESLSQEEIEQLIDDALKSDEIRTYINKKKTIFEDWSYNGRNLKDVISEAYSSIIEDESDLYRIYINITRNARIMKRKNPDMNNNEIIITFFTVEFISTYIEDYKKRKIIRQEVDKKNKLFDNMDDFQYIRMYALENNLDVNEIIRISNNGFNYYSSIIILEYSIQYNVGIDELIAFTLNLDESNINYLLWLFKLGVKSYISDIIENNKKLINGWIYKFAVIIFNGSMNAVNYEDIYSFLSGILIQKHIIITSSIDNLFLSFCAFVKSCIKRYLLETRAKNIEFQNFDSLDDENFYIQIPSSDNLEDDYIASEEIDVINNAIDELDDLEREFIDLRYGFSGNQHNLYEIKRIWESKEIYTSIEELEKMEMNILEKLRNNPDILKLNRAMPSNAIFSC